MRKEFVVFDVFSLSSLYILSVLLPHLGTSSFLTSDVAFVIVVDFAMMNIAAVSIRGSSPVRQEGDPWDGNQRTQ